MLESLFDKHISFPNSSFRTIIPSSIRYICSYKIIGLVSYLCVNWRNAGNCSALRNK